MVLTTWEAERVNRLLQKQSLEGSWASFTNPISLASLFINLAFGTLFIVTLCLFIGHLYGDSKTVGETLMLVIGCLMMIVVGGILVVSIDDVPDKIFDNTVVLGVLALVAAVLLLTDAGTKCASKPKIKKKGPPASKKKEIEVVPSEQPKNEIEVVEERIEDLKHEEEPKRQTEETVKESGISSVEIRIKDPKKNWPVYGERTRATSEIDVLAEAEAVDKMLSRGVALGRARGHLPRLSESPVRHTSSFYITQAPQFAWKRLSEK
ncbi:uncharacterized protein isoform X2 [Rhodnius prolixus]